MAQQLSVEFSFTDITDILALYVSVFIYIQTDLYINCHTPSTPVELYENFHIFYEWIILNIYHLVVQSAGAAEYSAEG